MDITRKIDLGTIATSKEERRSYVGASGVGNPCELALQYSLRGYPQKPPPPAVKRIFEMGHIVEELVVKHLRDAGYSLLEVDPTTKEQFAYTALGGHLRGHADGMIDIDGKPHVLEIKSMNDKKWNTFKSRGVKNSHRIYFDQVQLLMGLSGIQNAVVVAYNKNNSLYHYEYVAFDYMCFKGLISHAERVIRQQSTERVSDNPLSFSCRYCNFKPHCWPAGEKSLAVEVECKTCRHAKPVAKRKWLCTKYGSTDTTPCNYWARIEPKQWE